MGLSMPARVTNSTAGSGLFSPLVEQAMFGKMLLNLYLANSFTKKYQKGNLTRETLKGLK